MKRIFSFFIAIVLLLTTNSVGLIANADTALLGWYFTDTPVTEMNYSRVYADGEKMWVLGGNQVFYSVNYPSSELIKVYDNVPAETLTDFSVIKDAGNYSVFAVGNGNTFIRSTNTQGTEFENVTVPWNGGIQRVQFLTPLIGFVVSSTTVNSETEQLKGSLWKTTDGGSTWLQVNENVNQQIIRAIAFVSEDLGFVGTVDGNILKTQDGGLTWNSCIYAGRINDMFFLDANHGWAVSNDEIIKYENGTWTFLQAHRVYSLSSVFFLNENEGWVTGEETLHTTDGGLTWHKEEMGTWVGTLINDIYFTSEGNGYAVGKYAGIPYNGGYSSNYGVITHYGDKTNVPEQKPSLSIVGIQNVTDHQAQISISILSKGYSDILEQGVVYSTQPNPTTNNVKVQQSVGADNFMLGLNGLNPSTTYYVRGYAINPHGTSYTEEATFTTLDADYSWVDISLNLPESAKGNTSLPDMYFWDDDTGVIVNSVGKKLYYTEDGGLNYTTYDTPAVFNAICFKDALIGYAAGQDGRIYKTSDKGITWKHIGGGSSPFYGIAYNEALDSVFVCGMNATIKKVDASDHVTSMSTGGLVSSLYSISFAPNGEGVVCGGELILYYDVEKDKWGYEREGVGVSYPSGSYNAICIMDNHMGWAVGNKAWYENSIIIHTTDSLTWEEQVNPDQTVNRGLMDIFFLNTNEGWTVGTGGVVLHTKDSGVNWQVEGDGLTTNYLTSVQFTTESNGYALGNKGTLLKYGPAQGNSVDTDEIISTIAGDGFGGYSGDGGLAVNARLNAPNGIAVDSVGNIYIADTYNNCVRKIDKDTKVITTVASFHLPYGIVIDSEDNILVSMGIGVHFSIQNGYIKKIDKDTGTVTKIAGGATEGYHGDGGPATAAGLNSPKGIALDGEGNIYVACEYHLRKIDQASGIITTVAYIGADGIAIDTEGNIYCAIKQENKIVKIDKITNEITTVAGTGSSGFDGDNKLATEAKLYWPRGVVLDADGNLYIADAGNNRVRRVDINTGMITTIAGTGTNDYAYDGALAENAWLSPIAVTMDVTKNIYISGNNVIRSITTGSAVSGELAEISTGNVTGISASKAEIPAIATSDGGSSISERGVVYAVSEGPTTQTGMKVVQGSGQGSFKVNLSGLSPATLYHARIYAINDNGTAYGIEFTFTTLATEGWTEMPSPGGNENYKGVFADGNKVWVLGVNKLYYSSDYPTVPLTVVYENEDLYFNDFIIKKSGSTYKGWLFGGSGGPRGVMTEDIDAGIWTDMHFKGSGAIISSNFASDDVGYAGTMMGCVLKTIDGGNNWNVVNNYYNRYVGMGINALAFTDENTGYMALGAMACALMETNDGGVTWTESRHELSGDATDIYFVNTEHGFSVGRDILYYKNGEFISEGIKIDGKAMGALILDSVYFINENEGWAAGSNGTVLHTEDKGIDWETQKSGTTNWLTDIFFTSSDCGYAVGGHGTILRFISTSLPPVATVPTVMTEAITNIAANQATLSGNVTYDGGSAVTERGLVYSTSLDPTVEVGITIGCGSGSGGFAQSLTGLAPSTIYHVRAYAVNSMGISYGEDRSFTTTTEVQDGGGNVGGNDTGNNTNNNSNDNGNNSIVIAEGDAIEIAEETVPLGFQFTDISGHWAEGNIYSLVEKGAVNGYPDNTFRPDEAITRAEFAIMIIKAFELPLQEGHAFDDCKDHWASEYIEAAAYYKIVKGYNEEMFGPDDYITRQQMAAMLSRTLLLPNAKVALSFNDTLSISGWAMEDVKAVVKNSIMRGYLDNTFRPKSKATRSEAVTAIVNALD